MKKPNERAIALATVAELVPPELRQELLGEEKLRAQFDLEIDPVLDLGPEVGSFKASLILKAVRAAADAPGKVAKLLDQKGRECEVLVTIGDSTANLAIKSASHIVLADHFLLLTDNARARQLFFSQHVNTSSAAKVLKARWQEIVNKRALSHSELGKLVGDIAHTPEAVASIIQEQLRLPQLPLQVLVPQRLEYYEYLVGRLSGQKNIYEYIEQVAIDHIRDLLEWDSLKGLQAASLLGAHSLISDLLAKDHIVPADFSQVALWATQTDPMTRTIILETALKRSGDSADTSTAVQQLVESIRVVEPPEVMGMFAIFSGVFHMVDGEVGKLRIAAAKPPYWRRLASMAHAAVVTRCMLANGEVAAEVLEGMDSIRLTEYQMQSVVDMRTEPRWQGDFASPTQLRHEFAGRILNAAAQNERTAIDLGVWDALLGDTPGALKNQINASNARLPGPLEGNVDPMEKLSEELLERMRASLSDPSLSILSFALVSNTALFVKLPEDVLVLAADAVRRANYHLDPKGKPEWVETCLTNLATAAAVNRNCRLADEMFTILRSYRRLFSGELSLDGAIRVGLIACASREELGQWCECVGALMNDLSFGEIDRGEAQALYFLMISLCDLVPEMWVNCGQGIAAVEAVAWR
jgi:hypothetical protein